MKLRSLSTTMIIVCLIIVCCLLYAPALHAEVPDPGTDPDIPIDGGLSLLIAAGIGYGAKRAYDKRKKAQKATDDLKKVE
ncbi:MAG TPA: hypothetical protein VFV68_02220 [Agriterribacter sp.]|nr:hypothetical protein [Agriterribacter sp.]